LTTSLPAINAERAFKDWVNAQSDLAGPGRPLPKGATLARLQGALTAAYAYLTRSGGGPALGAESPHWRAAMAAQVYGPSKDAASRGADALAVALMTRLAGLPAVIPGAGTILVVDNLTGPVWDPDFDEARYTLRFDGYLALP
jgi:hypothetical protein